MGELQGVPDTLFVPLAARIRVSRRFPEYFHDQTALSREGSIPGDAALTASEYGRIASVARYRSVDRMTRAFVAERGRCHIINLGAGLETAAFRLADLDAKFYEVDLPEVIAARSTVIPQGPNEVLVGGDVLTLGWTSYLDPATPSLFVALGLLQYFHREEVIGLISGLHDRLPGSELIFDATSRAGLRRANRRGRMTSGTAALMHFYVNDAEALARACGGELVEQRPFLGEARTILGKRLRLSTRLALTVADRCRHATIIHLTL